MTADLWHAEQTATGVRLRLNLHYGQTEAWQATERFILILAGSQAGKTSFEPLWLYREIRRCGPGEYGVIGPTDDLLQAKCIPEFRRLFEQALGLGRYVSSPRPEFRITSKSAKRHLFNDADAADTVIKFRHASDPESLEAATWKAAVCDEAGQKLFKAESWNAIQRRVALHAGRVLFGTTPYRLGWLKSEVYDRAGKSTEWVDSVKVVNFSSLANPQFPRDEWRRQKRRLPTWMFDMMYRGRFSRPAGRIFGCWDERRNIIPRPFTIPDHWPRWAGLDFGGVNTAALLAAQVMMPDGTPTNSLIAYREYHEGGLTASGHAAAILTGEPMVPTAFGGAASEQQWRDEFGAGDVAIPVYAPPIRDSTTEASGVELGILRLYGMIKTGRLAILEGTCPIFHDQVLSYSRPLDELGRPMEGIENKSQYHVLDAGRYLAVGFEEPYETPRIH